MPHMKGASTRRMTNKTAKDHGKTKHAHSAPPEPTSALAAADVIAPVTISITTKKQWSKWLKFSGAALLLFAFGMQIQQNTQSALALKRTQAAELQSRTKQKAIGYETLY